MSRLCPLIVYCPFYCPLPCYSYKRMMHWRSVELPCTLVLALLMFWLGQTNGSECVQKLLAPYEIDPAHIPQRPWGDRMFAPNELTVVVHSGIVDDPAIVDRLWIYRRTTRNDPFHLIQILGNGTMFDTLSTAFGWGDYLVVGDLLGTNPFDPVSVYTNYTLLEFDKVTNQYTISQVLDPLDRNLTVTEKWNGAMCSNWIFLLFRVNVPIGISPRYRLVSFLRNPDTGRWARHSNLTDAEYIPETSIAISSTCNRLVTRFVTSDKFNFVVYNFSSAEGDWVETQRWPTPDIGNEAVQTMVLDDTHLYAGLPGQAYNTTNGSIVEQAGTVVEYLWNGTHFLLHRPQLFQSTPSAGSYCGYSLSLRDETLVVGCPGYNTTHSFADQCHAYPTLCNTTACANLPETHPPDADAMLFIGGRIDQYALNATSNEYDFRVSRDETCNASLPWHCDLWGSGDAFSPWRFGHAVGTFSNDVFVTAPFDWLIGQVYFYSNATTECDECSCPEGSPCGNPREPTASSQTDWTMQGVVIGFGSSVLIVGFVVVIVFMTTQGVSL